MLWDLKLATGKIVQWEGATGLEAARRYVDAMRVAGTPATVIASRRPSGAGVYVLGSGTIEG